MNERRMVVDPSLAVVGARRTLRRLELEAYASVMSAFRAQGPLTGDKKASLDQLGKLLGISSERHRAEVRRAVNDELLSAVAGCICSADSEVQWRKEGQKLASTNPRFVARQLSHLPQLLTSAAVSSALGLQSARADPDLKKNTSAQVQNVLKFIISQNPLNAASTAKQQLGKVGVSTGGKTLVKSPSKSPAVSAASPPVASSISPAAGTTTITIASASPSPPTVSPDKTPMKEERGPTAPATGSGSGLVSSPAKAVSVSLGKLTSMVKSDPTKLSKILGGGGGKTSMLMGLLEGRTDAGGGESPSVSIDVRVTGTNETPADEMKMESMDGGVLVGDKEKTESEGAVEVSQKQEEKEIKEDEQRPRVSEEQPTEVMEEHNNTDGTEDEQKGKEVVGGSTELVCEETMPEPALQRDKAVSTVTSSVAEPHTPGSEVKKEDTELHSPTLNSETSMSLEKNQQPQQAPEPLEQVSAGVPALTEESAESAAGGDAEETHTTTTKQESRKRPCPTDLNLPPSKKTHLSPPPPSLPAPPPSHPAPPPSHPAPPPSHPTPPPSHPAPPPSLPAPLTSCPSLPVPALTPAQPGSSGTADKIPSVKGDISLPGTTSSSSSSQSPGPPPLLLIPPSEDLSQEPFRTTGVVVVSTEAHVPLTHQVDASSAVKMFGSVTVQPLLPSHTPASLSVPTVCSPVDVTRPASTHTATLTSSHSAGVTSDRLPPLSLPTSTLPGLNAQPSAGHVTYTVLPTSITGTPSTSNPLQLPSLPATEQASLPSTSPSSHLQMTAGSSASDEALIRELCSEAADDASTASLVSQLGLGFLDQSFLGGMELMQLVQSPFETQTPTLDAFPSIVGSPITTPGVAPLQGAVNSPGVEGKGSEDTTVIPDTTQLLSEALTSLSTPSTPILPSSLPPSSLPPSSLLPSSLPPSSLLPSSLPSSTLPDLPTLQSSLFASSPSVSTAGSPSLPPLSSQPQDPISTSTILTPHSSPFTTHTPSILPPHTPSLSSPLTPEIIPDLDSLSSVNEADLLEGIPPELAETIQALAQYDQQNYQSPL